MTVLTHTPPAVRSRLAPHALAGAAIVLVALALRVAPVGFGLPLLLKPDENRMVEVAFVMADAGFQHWFLVYPHLLFILEWAVFMTVFVAGRAAGTFASYQAFRVWRHGQPHVLHLVSRIPVALLGATAPALLQGLAHRAAGPAAGLIAAALLAVNPMHVKESMYFSVDVPMVTLCLVALWLACECAERGSAKLLWLGGVAGGLAAGTKYPAAALCVPLTVAWALAWRRHGTPFRHLVLCGALMIGAFLIATPIALVKPHLLLEQVRILGGRLATPHAGIELGPGWLYHLTVSLSEGLTPPVAVAALAGVALHGATRSGLVLASFALALFATFASSHTVFQRYVLPIVPVACWFAGCALSRAHDALALRFDRPGRLAGLALIAFAVAVPLARSLAYDAFLRRDDTRLVARRWVEANVPPGTGVAMIGTPWCDIQLEKDLAQDDPWRPERMPYLRRGRELGLTRFLPQKTYRVRYGGSFEELGAAGFEYAVVGDHPWHRLATLPERIAARADATEPVFAIDPIVPGAPPARYDMHDAWLVPTGGFLSLTAPGPRIRIYRLR